MKIPDPRRTSGGAGDSWSAGPFLTLGLELALSVLVCFFVGRWLDERWGTAPWMLIAGLVLGSVAGFIHFFRTAMAIGKRQDEQSKERRGRM